MKHFFCAVNTCNSFRFIPFFRTFQTVAICSQQPGLLAALTSLLQYPAWLHFLPPLFSGRRTIANYSPALQVFGGNYLVRFQKGKIRGGAARAPCSSWCWSWGTVAGPHGLSTNDAGLLPAQERRSGGCLYGCYFARRPKTYSAIGNPSAAQLTSCLDSGGAKQALRNPDIIHLKGKGLSRLGEVQASAKKDIRIPA